MKWANDSSFKKDLEYVHWSLATDNDSIDLAFRSFFHLFLKVLDKHVPQKETVIKNKNSS